jgi:hypothetical protein
MAYDSLNNDKDYIEFNNMMKNPDNIDVEKMWRLAVQLEGKFPNDDVCGYATNKCAEKIALINPSYKNTEIFNKVSENIKFNNSVVSEDSSSTKAISKLVRVNHALSKRALMSLNTMSNRYKRVDNINDASFTELQANVLDIFSQCEYGNEKDAEMALNVINRVLNHNPNEKFDNSFGAVKKIMKSFPENEEVLKEAGELGVRLCHKSKTEENCSKGFYLLTKSIEKNPELASEIFGTTNRYFRLDENQNSIFQMEACAFAFNTVLYDGIDINSSRNTGAYYERWKKKIDINSIKSGEERKDWCEIEKDAFSNEERNKEDDAFHAKEEQRKREEEVKRLKEELKKIEQERAEKKKYDLNSTIDYNLTSAQIEGEISYLLKEQSEYYKEYRGYDIEKNNEYQHHSCYDYCMEK